MVSSKDSTKRGIGNWDFKKKPLQKNHKTLQTYPFVTLVYPGYFVKHFCTLYIPFTVECQNLGVNLLS